ncbi:MAG: threonine/serine dehydratase, partial [Alphaproteobacteria bacterium]
FKFRGAYNMISRLSEKSQKTGVVAYSSGNHAQGVAAAAQILGIPATIVMPRDAPQTKIANTKFFGADVILYDRQRESRELIAGEIARSRNATIVPPYEHALIMAGQGTVGLEALSQMAQLNISPDVVLIPCGGGGLSAGISIAVKALCPSAEIYSVEPEGFNDTARSLAAGHRVSAPSGAHSFCDALLSPLPGEQTFAVNLKNLHGGLGVSDQEVAQAVQIAFLYLKLVVEPGGAVALAAALSQKLDLRDKVVLVICSGGNVDSDVFVKILQQSS